MSACGSPLSSNTRIDPAIAVNESVRPGSASVCWVVEFRWQPMLLGMRLRLRRAARAAFLARRGTGVGGGRLILCPGILRRGATGGGNGEKRRQKAGTHSQPA